MNALSLFVTIVVIVSILALITIIWIKFGSSGIESPERRAGRMGEKFASGIIEEILDNTDVLLRNVHITHNGEQTELDNVIINNAGAYAAALSPIQFSSQEKPEEFFLKTDGSIKR